MRVLWNRLTALFRRDRIDRELDEELRFHAELAEEALRQDGLGADEARAAARLRLGNTLQLRERGRDAWSVPPLDTLVQDVRHAGRLLRRHSSYSVPALGTLALGIGLTTAIFSVVYGLLLEPLPYRDPQALVAVLPQEPTNTAGRAVVSWAPPDFHELRAARAATADIAAYTGTMTNLTGRGGPLHLQAVEVTPNFFDLLGTRAARGRTFGYVTAPAGTRDGGTRDGHASSSSTAATAVTPSATNQLRIAPEDARTVVLGDRFWRTAFDADPALLGQSITIGGTPRTVIGILPPDFTFQTSTFISADAVDAWLPNDWADGTRSNAFLQLVARRQPGMSDAQTAAALTGVMRRLAQLYPRTPSVASVVPLHDYTVGTVRRLLLIFSGAVGFVLLIACVNVASLQLARLSARRHELSLRAALGAGRVRIARQLITEALLLALAGGVLGVALAYLALPVLVALLPAARVPRHTEIAVSLPVLGFALVTSLAAGLGFGLLPAMRSAAAEPDALRGGVPRMTGTRAAARTRGLLVATQVALTLVLLAGAALLLRSFVSLLQVRPGFDTTNLVSASLFLPEETYGSPSSLHAFSRRVMTEVRALPGVASASAVNFGPVGMNFLRGDYSIEGRDTPEYAEKVLVESGYFQTMGVALREGRDFSERDDADAPPVAIVSEQLARQVWPAQSAIGQRVSMDGGGWMTIVGVAGGVHQFGPQDQAPPMLYVPYQQNAKLFFLRSLTIVIRTRTPVAMAQPIRQILRGVDPNLPLMRVATFDDLLSDVVAEPRFRSVMLVGFALSALAIATVGIYGLLAYTIAQRRRELGVRLALGAAPAQIVRLVLRRVLTPVFAGLLVGLGLAGVTMRLLQAFLFEVQPTDPRTLAAAALLLAAVAVAAIWLPSRRAARINPLETLRAE